MKNIVCFFSVILLYANSLSGQEQASAINMVSTPNGIYADLNNMDFGNKSYVVLRKENQQAEYQPVLQHNPVRSAKELAKRINDLLFHMPDSSPLSDSTVNMLWSYWHNQETQIEFVTAPAPHLKLYVGLAFLDTSVALGKSYDYIIENEDGDRYSGSVVHRLDTIDFAAMRSFDVDPGEGYPELRFRSSIVNGAPSFEIYRKISGGFDDFEKIHTTKGMVLNETQDSVIYFTQDTTVLQSVRYDYFIRGKDLMGNLGIASDTVSLQVGGNRNVNAGFNINTTAVDGGIRITWDSLDQRYALQNILIYKSADYDTGYALLATLPVTDTEFIDYDVIGGGNYYYQLLIQGESNMSFASARTSGLYQGVVNLVPPHYVRGEIIDDKPQLSWMHQDSLNVAGYYVYRAVGRNGELQQVSNMIPYEKDSVTTFLDSTATDAGEVIYYGITAVSKTQSLSPMSELIAISIPEHKDKRMSAPDQLQVIWMDRNSVLITWRDMDRWEGSIDRYNIYRKPKDSVEFPEKPVATVEINEYVDTLRAKDRYDYAVQSVSIHENQSALSTPIHIERIPEKFLPPLKVRVMENKGKVYLTWDGSEAPIQKYHIYRVVNTEPPVLYKTLDGNLTAIEDTDIKQGNNYLYYVACVDQDEMESDWSEEVIYSP
ncbi:fibronectin type III domain-containing protein [Sphingobacterium chuzhouense]|uniref:Fibronectin type-III domain-containing protein n=1 Tax=Sphingobacterium chuzhouense TaxID=1742264 RepID=A0ABR7XM68_9SPHI|nr:hypothetical protein [Sphingobacterium chuzhouense]MBD1420267.1 hypothetical protein [Sphingobacterium chuzhouense]